MFSKKHFSKIWIGMLTVVCVLSAFSQAEANRSSEKYEMLKFTSSGHVLGFQENGVVIASGNHVLREGFMGTEGSKPQPEPLSSQDDRSQTLGKVTYPDLWEGITLTYDRPPGGILRSTYRIEPGADPGRIALLYNVPVKVDRAGNLVFHFNTGTMTASAPVAWQDIDGKRLRVDAAFGVDRSLSIAHFVVGDYNPHFPLFIDPTLTWNTFLGSRGADSARAIAVDGSGNIYVTGKSESNWGSPKCAHARNSDAFVAKLRSTGELQWNTFMGSSRNDSGYAITVDGEGNIYVAGRSESSWGIPKNCHAGDFDAFAAKLNSNGELQWNTFIGSSDYDCGYAVAVDPEMNVYVGGESGDIWGVSPVNGHGGGIDAFAAKLSSSGELQWNTFMGSSDADSLRAIAVDGSGNVYMAGYSFAAWGRPVSAYSRNFDAFVVKLDCSGALLWNTFMGSFGHDYAHAITVDGSGNIYVSGESDASWGRPLKAHAGNFDAFAAKLDNNGMLQWNTFMGSFSNDYGRAIAVDGEGNVYMAGRSKAAWGSAMNPHAGGYDAFAAELSNGGAFLWNTFMGSSNVDYGYGIAVDGSGSVLVAGESEVNWGGPVKFHAGGYDGFVTRISK